MNRTSLNRYKNNLKVDDSNIFSYETKVATIDHAKRTIKILGYWSMTTSKHINFVGREYDYTVIK